MTYDELLTRINGDLSISGYKFMDAFRAVVKLHKPSEAWGDTHCGFCFDIAWEPSGLYMDEKYFTYPCPTIQAIEKELQ